MGVFPCLELLPRSGTTLKPQPLLASNKTGKTDDFFFFSPLRLKKLLKHLSP